MTTYSGYLTHTGLALDANSMLTGTAVVCDTMVFSNSQTPVHQGLTGMPSVVASVQVNDVRVTAEDPNVALVEAILPPEVGGFWIHSIGVLDTNGNLYAVANVPPSYKPALPEGAGEDLLQIVKFVTANATNINVSIDPSVVRASRPWVENELLKIATSTAISTVNLQLEQLRQADKIKSLTGEF